MKVATALVTTWIVLAVAAGLSVGFSWRTALSGLLAAGALLAAMRAPEGRGWPLVWILFALYGGIGSLNIHLEAVFFSILPVAMSVEALAKGLMVAFAASLLMVWTAGRMPPQNAPERRSPSYPIAHYWRWRALVTAFCYVVLYFAAGIIVLPYVGHFYAGRPMPSPRLVVAMQLVRGLVYVAAMLPFVQWMSGHRWRAALILVLCLSVFGGIAPLLLPNKYLPADILPFHMVEIGASNFLFGLVAALLLVRRKRPDIVVSLGASPGSPLAP